MTRSRTTLAILVALPLLLVGLGASRVHTVGSDEMSPSIRAGDRVLIIPRAPLRGDVVALEDPLDPERVVLRRAIADGDKRVRYENGELRVDVKRIRQKDMGELDGDRVTQETMWSKPPARANLWLLRYQKEPVHWEAEPVAVPEGSWYLLADHRDRALDSRWWGPISEEKFLGVVRVRYGPADDWRPELEFLNPIP